MVVNQNVDRFCNRTCYFLNLSDHFVIREGNAFNVGPYFMWRLMRNLIEFKIKSLAVVTRVLILFGGSQSPYTPNKNI